MGRFAFISSIISSPLQAEQMAESRSCYLTKGFHSRWSYQFRRIPSFGAFYEYNSVCDGVRYPARSFWLVSRVVGDKLL
ncbi:hypothetical protein BJX66DRAFT_295328 [Aspergillus keveii]|uniref:Secreted protein n=1 Tax=Aspergillus keveii TaxID=714993 RepID=A0ABR4GHT0_9EURO